MEAQGNTGLARGLRTRDWLLSYRTSSTIIQGRPVDMLHDFYIPALSLALGYDRVAGYFRSSSLAAASQGFSSFVGRRGKMRLIVGADLDPQDVKAILAGDSQRLAAALNSRLKQPASWPEEVQNGVQLLAWMVAQGFLEVRVAFRVHGETGQPLSWEAVEDGYVHEKWFILRDEDNNRLYGTGTLNESRTALIRNAENIDIHCDWWGATDRLRVEEAEKAFEQLWRGQVHHLPVLTLPEAVERRLIKMAEGLHRPVEIDGTPGKNAAAPPSVLERLGFAVLKDGPKMPGGRYVGMETAPVEPWPHQAVVVKRLVENWPYSYLLCDEVGLGKTIEAGLAFRSLYLTGLAQRILIAAPASLTHQWQRQMAGKMLLSFGRVLGGSEARHHYIFPVEEERPAASIYEPGLTLVSTGLMARRERRKALQQAAPFDIALVDEAHAARRQNPSRGLGAHPDYGQLYTTIGNYLRPKTRSLWLVTATPMQIDPVEACDLLALTNRAGPFQFDAALTLEYYNILGRILRGGEVIDQEWEFLRKSVLAVQTQDPLRWQYLQNNVIAGRIRVSVHQWLKTGRVPRGRDRQLLCRLLFSASPLSRVMLRHTRRLLELYRDNGQLGENLAQRHILPLPRIVFNPLEQAVYDHLEEYCAGLARQIRKHGDSKAHTAMGFFLNFLRLRFASSLFALQETLRRRLEKVENTLRQRLHEGEVEEGEDIRLEDLLGEEETEDDSAAVQSLLKNRTPADLRWERKKLKAMIAGMAGLTGPSTKMSALLQKLDERRLGQRIEQTVIFTRFFDTLTDIVDRLRQVNPQMLVGTYSGQGAQYYDSSLGCMKKVDREEVKERFLRGEIDILVCTDAAAEGLNLQTADLLVNFDLGWNPMKVEQRIGRIDRIGQKHPHIHVLNLCYAGSAEEIVYGRLLSRLSAANLIVGTQQFSLLPVRPEEFQDLAEGRLSPEALMEEAQKQLEQQREQIAGMEIPPEDLYDSYMRGARLQKGQPVPVRLPDIWAALQDSKYLRDLGCVAAASSGEQALTLSGINGVPEGAILTTSRSLYEEGLAAGGGRVHFASYGDPYFAAVLEQVTGFELPPCVRRLTVSVPGLPGVEMVAYAVACKEKGGKRVVRLIRGWPDLQGIDILETESLSEAEVEPLQLELAHQARKEYQVCLAAERLERENLRAGRGQELLNLLVIHNLLEARACFAGDKPLFWPVLEEVESLFQDRDVRVDDLPADVMRRVEGDLLFECHVPSVGTAAYMVVNRVLARSAITTAQQIANSLKLHKAELGVDTMLARLRREAEEKRLLL